MNDFITFIWANILVGISSFGGGKAFIPIYQSIFVDTFKIVDTVYLTELIGYASALPGPIAPMITGPIGYDFYGYKGFFLGLLSLSLPTLLLYFIVAKLVNNSESKFISQLYLYLSPSIIALLLFVSFKILLNTTYGNKYLIFSLISCGIYFLIFYKTKKSPALILLLSGIVGILVL